MSVLYIRALILFCVESALLSFHFGNFCFHSVCLGKRSLLFPDQAGNSFFFSFSMMLQYSVLFWVLSVYCLFVLSPISVTGEGGFYYTPFHGKTIFLSIPHWAENGRGYTSCATPFYILSNSVWVWSFHTQWHESFMT